VDLDPYDSPSVFLDSAVQSVVDGGMLMCIATDMAVLCGGNMEVCSSKFLALACHLEEIHVTWAHLEKKRTRLQLYTKSDEENSHTVDGDGVTVFREGVRISCDTIGIVT
ncbi:probable tRNA (guanine(26)-N(2))-dimethyltransferase 2, partial [Tanacetum coccineum]